MKKTYYLALAGVMTLVALSVASAQFPEDALRLSYFNLSLGARSLGMGTAYTAVADDYSAISINPAGIGQLHMNEVSLGLSHDAFGNTSTFYGNSVSLNNSATNINSAGLVYAVPATRGGLSIALGYDR